MNLHPTKPKKLLLKPIKQEKPIPHVAVSELKCKFCGKDCIKNGKEKNGQQRFKCKDCNKSQQANYAYHAYDQNLNENIIALTKEGVGIRGTARLLGIAPTTLIARIKKIASEIKEPVLIKGKTYEVDELRTFIKKKES